MAKGISLHIGLNKVDPNRYGGWDGRLAGCINDAHDMQALAGKLGYETSTLIDDQATSKAVIAAMKGSASRLRAGDIFLCSYSGHGGQVPDTNGDESAREAGEVGGEEDEYDETWVLYDRQLVDDELWSIWAAFPEGCRVVVVSDSCHSGTVAREPPAFLGGTPQPVSRRMPLDVEERDYTAHRTEYERIQRDTPPREANDVKATVALISGCQDNQTSADGDGNGLFTSKLLEVWKDGTFRGSLKTLRNRTSKLMPVTQSPNFYVVGTPNPAFLRARSLRI
jgi:metacaspase-1